MRNSKGIKVTEKSVHLTNKSQDNYNINELKLSENREIKRINKRNWFSTQGSKRKLMSPTPLNKENWKDKSTNKENRNAKDEKWIKHQRSKTALQGISAHPYSLHSCLFNLKTNK